MEIKINCDIVNNLDQLLITLTNVQSREFAESKEGAVDISNAFNQICEIKHLCLNFFLLVSVSFLSIYIKFSQRSR